MNPTQTPNIAFERELNREGELAQLRVFERELMEAEMMGRALARERHSHIRTCLALKLRYRNALEEQLIGRAQPVAKLRV